MGEQLCQHLIVLALTAKSGDNYKHSGARSRLSKCQKIYTHIILSRWILPQQGHKLGQIQWCST